MLVTVLAADDRRPIDLGSYANATADDVSYTQIQDNRPSLSLCSARNCTGAGCNEVVCAAESDANCQPCWSWNAGVEGTFLDPHFHNTDNPQANQALGLVDPGWSAAPRIWLGIENNSGWGARVRYWELGDSQSLFGIRDFQPGSIFDVTQSLNMYDIDVELTKQVDLGSWNLLGSFGGRFGSLDRLVRAGFLDLAAPANSMSFMFNNRVNAGGLTASLELSRPIGIAGLEVFGSFRASELWGDSDAFVAIRQNGAGTPSSTTFSDRFAADLTICEAQVGLQCSKQLAYCPGTVFARCAFEYQSWIWSVPGGSPGQGLIFDPGVDLYGVAFAIGFCH
ncbi:MAG TPA: hypothetical protein VGJ04_09495 [Pirellulales bacterium]